MAVAFIVWNFWFMSGFALQFAISTSLCVRIKMFIQIALLVIRIVCYGKLLKTTFKQLSVIVKFHSEILSGALVQRQLLLEVHNCFVIMALFEIVAKFHKEIIHDKVLTLQQCFCLERFQL